MFYKGQAIRDDIKIPGEFMGHLISIPRNLWDSKYYMYVTENIYCKYSPLLHYSIMECFTLPIYYGLILIFFGSKAWYGRGYGVNLWDKMWDS